MTNETSCEWKEFKPANYRGPLSQGPDVENILKDLDKKCGYIICPGKEAQIEKPISVDITMNESEIEITPEKLVNLGVITGIFIKNLEANIDENKVQIRNYPYHIIIWYKAK